MFVYTFKNFLFFPLKQKWDFFCCCFCSFFVCCGGMCNTHRLTWATGGSGTWLRSWSCGSVRLWTDGSGVGKGGRLRFWTVSGLICPTSEVCLVGMEILCRLMARFTAWTRTFTCLVSNSKLPPPDSHLQPASKMKVLWGAVTPELAWHTLDTHTNKPLRVSVSPCLVRSAAGMCTASWTERLLPGPADEEHPHQLGGCCLPSICSDLMPPSSEHTLWSHALTHTHAQTNTD